MEIASYLQVCNSTASHDFKKNRCISCACHGYSPQLVLPKGWGWGGRGGMRGKGIGVRGRGGAREDGVRGRIGHGVEK